MRFKLPRQIISQDVKKVISRELRKQKMTISRINKKNLKELAEISKAIKKWGLPKCLICKKLAHDVGYGVFLHPDAEMISKGQAIAPYAGEISLIPQNESDDGSYAFTPIEDICLKKEEQALFDKKRKYHPRRLYSLKVDARKKGNFTRFINHSEKPNVVAHLFAIPANVYGLKPASIEVVYIAKKNIYPGEQLLVCYEDGEKSYWGVSKIKPFYMTPKTFQLSSSLKIVASSSSPPK